MSKTLEFDYLIIGGGLAGMQLALAFSEDSYFNDKEIGIVELSDKNKNDKTWCFWERGPGKWDHITHHHWTKGNFKTANDTITLQLKDYQYKMVRSIEFYESIKTKINQSSNIRWIKDEVKSESYGVYEGIKNGYTAERVFDSRIEAKALASKKHIYIKQHFKGWIIETSKKAFHADEFTMMDFSLNYKNTCCFCYVLPTTEQSALIEFTFFTPDLLEQHVYDDLLKEYIREKLKIDDFTIKEVEYGVIPMSTYPFHKENNETHIKIGTAGGWVKASSGYSFKNTEKKVGLLVERLKKGKSLTKGIFKSRFTFYDRIFLRILQQENHLGNQLFEEMYCQNSAAEIFKFLDEETNLVEELKIINQFKKAPFLRSLKKEIG